MTRLLSAILIAAIFSTGAMTSFGQVSPTKQEKKAAKVKSNIQKLGTGEKVRVKVKLYNDTVYKGYLAEANADDFVVVDRSGGSNTIKYAEVDSIGGSDLSTGAKIAIGVGIGVGATLGFLFLLAMSLD